MPSYVARLLLSACMPIVLVLPLLLLGVLLLFAAGHWPAAAWKRELRISGRGSVYTLRRVKNDRCGTSGLSKIAHIQRLGLCP